MNNSWAILIAGIIAFLLTFVGLFIHLRRRKEGLSYSDTAIIWLFIPVFPLVFILASFPDSTTSGELLSFTVTGAFASYVLLWFAGIKLTMHGNSIDKLKTQIKKLEKKCTYVDTVNQINKGKEPKHLQEIEVHEYRLVKAPKKSIYLITGDLANIKGIDVWVNSENTDMQMARFGETSVSSIIRYLGAEKMENSLKVKVDTIANALREELQNRGKLKNRAELQNREELENRWEVMPSEVFVTQSGELKKSHGVEKIFHVASVYGPPMSGYKPIPRIQDCVKNCLEEFDELNKKIKAKSKGKNNDESLKSILFSLMGTGTAKGDLDSTVAKLLHAAITYMEEKKEKEKNENSVENVYFLTYTDRDLDACKKVLLETERVEYIAKKQDN